MRAPFRFTFGIVALAVAAATLALTLPSMFLQHDENDEVIYRVLAQKLITNPSDFSLKGTFILKHLPAAQYDYPIFRHPPVFFYLLMLIYKYFGVPQGMLLPVAGGVLTAVLGVFITRRLYDLGTAGIAGVLLCCCPFIIYGSTRLWIDTTNTCLMTLAFFVFIAGYGKRGYWWMAGAGIVLGVAILSKYTALGVVPAIAWYAFRKRTSLPRFAASMALYGVCAVVVCIPWLLHYAKLMGSVFASQFTITQEMIDRFPFVKQSVNQPVYFYFAQLAAVAPVYILGLFGCVKSWRETETQTLLIWAGTFLGGFTVLSLSPELGYGLRYLLPVVVPLALLSARVIERWRERVFPLVIVLLAYQLASGIINSYYGALIFADIRSPFFYLEILLRPYR